MTRLEAAVALDSQMSLLREAANKYEAGVTELDSIGAIASKLDAGSLAECASRFGIQASELLEYISSSSAVCHIDINELHRFYPNGYRNAWPLNFCLNDNGGLHGLVRRDDHVLMVVGDAFFTGTTNWQGDSRSIIMKNDATFDYGAITFSDRYGDVFFAKVFDKDVAIYVNAQYKLTIYEYTENGAFTLVAQETQANSSYNHVSSVIENNDGTITIIRCPMNSGTASSNYLMAKVTLLDENLAMEEVGLIASADFSNRNIVFTFKHDGGIYGFADYAGRPPSSGPYKPELYKLDLSTPSAELIKNDFNIQYCSLWNYSDGGRYVPIARVGNILYLVYAVSVTNTTPSIYRACTYDTSTLTFGPAISDGITEENRSFEPGTLNVFDGLLKPFTAHTIKRKKLNDVSKVQTSLVEPQTTYVMSNYAARYVVNAFGFYFLWASSYAGNDSSKDNRLFVMASTVHIETPNMTKVTDEMQWKDV